MLDSLNTFIELNNKNKVTRRLLQVICQPFEYIVAIST